MDEPRHIYLIGFMASGKSHLGRRLAESLGRDAVDLDREIEAYCGCSIPDLFARVGEAAFRSIEAERLAHWAVRPRPFVMATGGGIVLDPANRALMRETGWVLRLEVAPETVLARVGDVRTRPVLARAGDAEGIRALMAEREPAYAAAAQRTLAVDGLSAEAAVIRLRALIVELEAARGFAEKEG